MENRKPEKTTDKVSIGQNEKSYSCYKRGDSAGGNRAIRGGERLRLRDQENARDDFL